MIFHSANNLRKRKEKKKKKKRKKKLEGRAAHTHAWNT